MFSVTPAALFSSGHLLFSVHYEGTRDHFDVAYIPEERRFESVLRVWETSERLAYGSSDSCTDLAGEIVAWSCDEDPQTCHVTLAGQIFASIKPAHDDWKRRRDETEAFLNSPLGRRVAAKNNS